MKRFLRLMALNTAISAWFFGCFAAIGYPWGYFPGILGATTYFWAVTE